MHTANPILADAGPAAPGDECWICHDGEDGGAPLRPAPCKCKKRAHDACVLRWTLSRMAAQAADPRACARCEICRGELTNALGADALVELHVRGCGRAGAPPAPQPQHVQIVVRTQSMELEWGAASARATAKCIGSIAVAIVCMLITSAVILGPSRL